jgi:phosphatidylglycerol:prolipoprotein diacylglycerol transferase
MFPILVRLPNGFELRTYGVLLVVGVVVAVALSRRRASSFGLAPERVWDSVTWLVLPGIFGARLLYVAQHWDYYASRPGELYSLRFEGLTSFGGLIGGLVGFLVWKQRSKVDGWRFLDTISIPVLVAQAIGRVGCLLNGCCHGRPSDLWCAVPVHGLGTRHLPAQLLETGLLLVGAWAATRIERPRDPGGRSFGLMLAVFGASRFVYEFLRAGTQAEFDSGVASSVVGMGGLTNAQWLSLVMVAVGAFLAGRRPHGPLPDVPPA